MEKQIYKEIYEVEENHWWHKSEREILLSLFNVYSKKDLLLNAGCGTGITSSILKTYTKIINLVTSWQNLDIDGAKLKTELEHLLEED